MALEVEEGMLKEKEEVLMVKEVEVLADKLNQGSSLIIRIHGNQEEEMAGFLENLQEDKRKFGG